MAPPKGNYNPMLKSTTRTLIRLCPKVVRDKIFGLLDIQSKKAVRLVCRRWKSMVDQTIDFQVHLTQDTFSQVEKFGKKRKISELIVGFFSQPYPKSGWKLSVQSLNILADYRYEIYYETAVVTSGQTEAQKPALAMVVMPESKMQRLFKEFKNVKKITLSSMAVADIDKSNSFLKSMTFYNLEILNLAVDSDFGLVAIRDILSNTFRKLTNLSVTIKSDDDDMTLYSEMYEFVSRHKDLVLVKRNFVQLNGVHHSDTTNNNNTFIENIDRDHKLDAVVFSELLQRLGQVKLSHLDIHLLATEGNARKILELHMLQAQKFLTALHLSNLRPENMPVWRSIPSIVSQCSETLESLILDGCFCEPKEVDPPGPFFGKWVTPCKNLQVLEVTVCGISVVELMKIPKSKMRALCLGQMLTNKQIKYISENFLALEKLSLPQTHLIGFNDEKRLVSLIQFRRALQLPELSQLNLSTQSCKLKAIRRFAGSLLGVIENVNDSNSNQVISKLGDLEFIIDRSLFCYPDLV